MRGPGGPPSRPARRQGRLLPVLIAVAVLTVFTLARVHRDAELIFDAEDAASLGATGDFRSALAAGRALPTAGAWPASRLAGTPDDARGEAWRLPAGGADAARALSLAVSSAYRGGAGAGSGQELGLGFGRGRGAEAGAGARARPSTGVLGVSSKDGGVEVVLSLDSAGSRRAGATASSPSSPPSPAGSSSRTGRGPSDRSPPDPARLGGDDWTSRLRAPRRPVPPVHPRKVQLPSAFVSLPLEPWTATTGLRRGAFSRPRRLEDATVWEPSLGAPADGGVTTGGGADVVTGGVTTGGGADVVTGGVATGGGADVGAGGDAPRARRVSGGSLARPRRTLVLLPLWQGDGAAARAAAAAWSARLDELGLEDHLVFVLELERSAPGDLFHPGALANAGAGLAVRRWDALREAARAGPRVWSARPRAEDPLRTRTAAGEMSVVPGARAAGREAADAAQGGGREAVVKRWVPGRRRLSAAAAGRGVGGGEEKTPSSAERGAESVGADSVTEGARSDATTERRGSGRSGAERPDAGRPGRTAGDASSPSSSSPLFYRASISKALGLFSRSDLVIVAQPTFLPSARLAVGLPPPTEDLGSTDADLSPDGRRPAFLHLASAPSIFGWSLPYASYCGGAWSVDLPSFFDRGGGDPAYVGWEGLEDDVCRRFGTDPSAGVSEAVEQSQALRLRERAEKKRRERQGERSWTGTGLADRTTARQADVAGSSRTRAVGGTAATSPVAAAGGTVTTSRASTGRTEDPSGPSLGAGALPTRQGASAAHESTSQRPSSVQGVGGARDSLPTTTEVEKGDDDVRGAVMVDEDQDAQAGSTGLFAKITGGRHAALHSGDTETRWNAETSAAVAGTGLGAASAALSAVESVSTRSLLRSTTAFIVLHTPPPPPPRAVASPPVASPPPTPPPPTPPPPPVASPPPTSPPPPVASPPPPTLSPPPPRTLPPPPGSSPPPPTTSPPPPAASPPPPVASPPPKASPPPPKATPPPLIPSFLRYSTLPPPPPPPPAPGSPPPPAALGTYAAAAASFGAGPAAGRSTAPPRTNVQRISRQAIAARSAQAGGTWPRGGAQPVPAAFVAPVPPPGPPPAPPTRRPRGAEPLPGPQFLPHLPDDEGAFRALAPPQQLLRVSVAWRERNRALFESRWAAGALDDSGLAAARRKAPGNAGTVTGDEFRLVARVDRIFWWRISGMDARKMLRGDERESRADAAVAG